MYLKRRNATTIISNGFKIHLYGGPSLPIKKIKITKIKKNQMKNETKKIEKIKKIGYSEYQNFLELPTS